MQTELSRQFGMDIPLWGFSYEPKVVAAISREGGLGVLGCVRFGGDADEMEEVLTWLDKETGGKPYGVNVVVPVTSMKVDAGLDEIEAALDAMIPQEHKDAINEFLASQGVPEVPPDDDARGVLGWTPQTGAVQMEVAFGHDIALFSSALGPPPEEAVQEAHSRDVPVAALVGRVDQALKQREHGVDIVVAQGWEAGGHTGEVATMVLTPEVVDAVAPAPVLSAGGIGSGRQLAAALALGAQGAWTGSIWLGAEELEMPSDQTDVVVNATSSDTIRSRSLTGKPARQVKTPWIEFWEDPNTPAPLQMPLQYLVTNEAMHRMRAANRFDLLGTPGGQIVGSIKQTRTVAEIIASIRDEVADSARWIEGALADEPAG